MYHPQVVKPPIVNDFLKVKIVGHTEPKLVPEFLVHVYDIELDNNLVRDADNGGIK